ncbi:MAG: class I SAM-dependent methyltransferase [Pseudomonadota bacterium]
MLASIVRRVPRALSGMSTLRRARRRATEFDSVLAGVDRSGLRDALELGCDRGSLAAYLCAEYQLRVTGMDSDVKAVEQAAAMFARVPDLQFETLCADRLSASAQSFDLVIWHASAATRVLGPALIDELSRVVRPGGLVVLEHTSVHPWLSWVRRDGFAALTPDRLRTQFADHGLFQMSYPRRGVGLWQRHVLVLQKMAHWMQPATLA